MKVYVVKLYYDSWSNSAYDSECILGVFSKKKKAKKFLERKFDKAYRNFSEAGVSCLLKESEAFHVSLYGHGVFTYVIVAFELDAERDALEGSELEVKAY